jgi:hypothetical protein
MGGCSSGLTNRFPFHRVQDLNGDGIRSASYPFDRFPPPLSLYFFCTFGLGVSGRRWLWFEFDFPVQCSSLVLESLLNGASFFVIVSDQIYFSWENIRFQWDWFGLKSEFTCYGWMEFLSPIFLKLSAFVIFWMGSHYPVMISYHIKYPFSLGGLGFQFWHWEFEIDWVKFDFWR